MTDYDFNDPTFIGPVDLDAQEWDEEHIPNEDGAPEAPYDPEAQDDLERHDAEFPRGYRDD